MIVPFLSLSRPTTVWMKMKGFEDSDLGKLCRYTVSWMISYLELKDNDMNNFINITNNKIR